MGELIWLWILTVLAIFNIGWQLRIMAMWRHQIKANKTIGEAVELLNITDEEYKLFIEEQL